MSGAKKVYKDFEYKDFGRLAKRPKGICVCMSIRKVNLSAPTGALLQASAIQGYRSGASESAES